MMINVIRQRSSRPEIKIIDEIVKLLDMELGIPFPGANSFIHCKSNAIHDPILFMLLGFMVC